MTSLFDQEELLSGISKKLEASADSNRLGAGIYQSTENLREKLANLDGEEALHHTMWYCEWLDSACLALLRSTYSYLYMQLHCVASIAIAMNLSVHTHR